MNENGEYATLVVFTTLAPLSAGGLVGLLVARGAGQEPGIDWAAMLILATGLLALVVSLLHLGRPWRAPLALIHLGTSWLSREVILFGLFLVLLAGYALFPAIHLGGTFSNFIGYAGAIIGLASTVATGETYRLRSRPAWDQWLTVITFLLGALTAGSLFGFFISRQFDSSIAVDSYTSVLLVLLLVCALVVTIQRSVRHPLSNTEADLTRQLVLGSYVWVLIARIAAVLLAILFIVIGGSIFFLAWIPAVLGEFCDRFMFFKTVIPVTFRRRYT